MDVQGMSLVLEGGAFRTIFSAGILDALMEEGIRMPYVVAVSAGAINATSYVSNQPKRTLRVLTTYRNDKRYMSFRNFFKEKSIFGLDFACNVIPNQLDKFDWETYYQYPGKVEFGITNAVTGEIEYKDALTMDKKCMMLRASCAIPLLFPEIHLSNTPYFDGAITDPIPIKRAMEQGFKKHLIITTRPAGYVKKHGRKSKMVTKWLSKRYPNLVKCMQQHATGYNDILTFCHTLESIGEALILKPDYALNDFEKNISKINRNYQMGYQQAKTRMEEIKSFLANRREEPLLQ